MSPSPVLESPLVMVIDDQLESRETESELVRRQGCIVISAESAEKALLEAQHAPLFDAALCDINLKNRPNDRSGIDLSRRLKEVYPFVKIVGYSAYFGEDDLSEQEMEPFDRWFRRAEDSPVEVASAVRELAMEARAERTKSRVARLDDLREMFPGVYACDIEFVRRFVPIDQHPEVERSLSESGFRLFLVTSSAFSEVANPVAVWIRLISDGVEAEVYGHPQLGSFNDSVPSAIQDLIEVMELVKTDLDEIGIGGLGDHLIELRDYLTYALG
jgi:CheY-like chemotaxis protein